MPEPIADLVARLRAAPDDHAAGQQLSGWLAQHADLGLLRAARAEWAVIAEPHRLPGGQCADCGAHPPHPVTTGSLAPYSCRGRTP